MRSCSLLFFDVDGLNQDASPADFVAIRLAKRDRGSMVTKKDLFHETTEFCYYYSSYQSVKPGQSGDRYGAWSSIPAIFVGFLLRICSHIAPVNNSEHSIRWAAPDMTMAAVDRLNDGQRDCLRLVLAHLNSKEIARELGVSPHTVDQRLRTAMRILNAQSRFEAARTFAALDRENIYHPLIYQRSVIEPASKNGEQDLSSGRTGNEKTGTRDDGVSADSGGAITASERSEIRRRPLPVPRYRGERNSLATVERLGWILAIAIGSAVSFGGVVAGLEALSRLKG